jgi:phosphoglucosamine mutase
MPTPGIAYLTRTARACAGVVISASHNLYYDNGIKIFSPEGTKLKDDLAARIDEKMKEPMACVDSSMLGKASRMTDAQGRYIEYCKSTVPTFRRLSGLKIVIDCANGAAYDVAPHVLQEMGAEVVTIGSEPDGFNINRECGSTHMEQLMEKVVSEKADIGIALDGDADRVMLVDAAGNRVDGDQILFLVAKNRLQQQKLGGGIVGTVMTNLGLELALKDMRIPFIRTAVGDRYVHEALTERNWRVGGESSGHIICLDKNTTGDGIIAALEVLEVMVQNECDLADLVTGMDIYPQKMINVSVGNADGKDLVEDAGVVDAVKQAETELGRKGRIVLRPSGTEPVVRVMIEGEDQGQVERLTGSIAEVVESVASGG